MDILGNIKIWDTTELINFQTLKINEEVEDKGTKNPILKIIQKKEIKF